VGNKRVLTPNVNGVLDRMIPIAGDFAAATFAVYDPGIEKSLAKKVGL
jgi:hypothetical protein